MEKISIPIGRFDSDVTQNLSNEFDPKAKSPNLYPNREPMSRGSTATDQNLTNITSGDGLNEGKLQTYSNVEGAKVARSSSESGSLCPL